MDNRAHAAGARRPAPVAGGAHHGCRPGLWSVQPDSSHTAHLCALNFLADALPHGLCWLAGPVGISDAIGYTNMTLARATADASGRLLQPSQPIAALDVNYAVTAADRPSGYIWGASTSVSGQPIPHAYILGLAMASVRGGGRGDSSWREIDR